MAQGHYWVVTCKNYAYHEQKNPFVPHRIPIGNAPDYKTPRPEMPDYLNVPCDDKDCGRTFSYAGDEILLWSGDAVVPLPLI
jgi:hypothetical protein